MVEALALIGAGLMVGAWREFRADNRRDSALLAAFGVATTLAGATAWLA